MLHIIRQTKYKMLAVSAVVVVAALATLAASRPVAALSGGEFVAGNIISDAIFFNKDTMSPRDIQNFLNAKVPSCDTNGSRIYSGSQTRAQYGTSKGYAPPYICLKDYSQSTPTLGPENGLCGPYNGGNKSSAQIIYDVAQSCGINPQVLLVLLQKEQALVTDDWPWANQYRSATGYACPDTAPCDSQYYGFFNQVYNAARIYKKYARDATQYNYRADRINSILYNPNASCGRSNVFIQNQATAGLYVYTPYQPNAAALNNLYGTGDGCSAYGNRNFWRMFNDWFGASVGVQDLVTDGQGIYYVSNGYKYYIPSMSDYYNYGYKDSDLGRITWVSPATINAIPAKAGTPQVSVVVASAEQGIYIISNGYRHYVPSMSTLYNYGFTDSDIAVVSEASIGRFRLANNSMGDFISDSSGFAYKVENGKRRGIFQPWVLGEYPTASTSNGLSWVTINKIPIGVPLTKGKLGLTFGNQVFVAIAGKWFAVHDRDVASCIGVEGIVTMYANQTVPGVTAGTLNSCLVVNENSQRYLMDGSVKYAMQNNDELQYSGIASADAIDGGMTTIPYNSHKNIFATHNGIYQLQHGVLRHVMYMGFVQSVKGSTAVDVLSTNSLKHVSNGANIYETRTLVAGDRRGINVVDNDRIAHISSMEQFYAYGFNLGEVAVVGDAELDRQASSADLPGPRVACGGKYYVLNTSKKFSILSSTITEYGGSGNFQIINCGLVAGLPEASMSRFITSPNNKNIYYIDNGLRRHIRDWQTFLSLGGSSAENVITLNEYAFNSFPPGPAL